MAKKTEFIVIDGCIQEGKYVFLPGQAYSPPSTKLRDELLASGVIAKITEPAAQAAVRAAQPKGAAQPGEDDDLGGENDLLGGGAGD
ncbi:hypothetical protein [Pseudomonas knackmussii]|uniref:hypothetical protein n=1 Tax=Pseudomonas knackmussii TaxID=65741 RepID=UPI00136221CF|nr:hypothetical protein [Pseudomonas knackmussii]